jgi:hypothetical protein
MRSSSPAAVGGGSGYEVRLLIDFERSRIMKRWVNVLVFALAVTFGAAGAAQVYAQEVSRTIVIKRDTRLGAAVLPKGEYNVRFVEGKDGEVIFLQGKHEVLKATFTLAKLDQDASNSVVVSAANDDGSYQLKRIEFKGKSAALVFDNTVATAISKP